VGLATEERRGSQIRLGIGIAGIAFVIAFTTVAILYSTGPSLKLCSNYNRAQCFIAGDRPAKRTNAWERFKGAITGNR
jgi:hypothetical protein